MKISRTVPLWCCALSVACSSLPFQLVKKPPPHASFVATPREAPYEQRKETYEQLRPATEQRALFKRKKRREPGTPLLLANGVKVHYAEDLAPLVPADSVTATSIDRALYHRHKQQVWAGFATGFSALSASGLSLGLFVFTRADNQQSENTGIGIAVGSVVLGALSLALCVPTARAQDLQAQKATEDAFVNYAPALRTALGICQDGDRLTDCDAGPNSQPTKIPLKERIKNRWRQWREK
jgi:hypothetical protein